VIETRDLLLENQKLREENQLLKSQLQKDNLRISKLEHQLEQLLRIVYGKKSERYAPTIPGQISLPLDIAVSEKPEVKKETITYEREKPSGKSNHKGRLPLPEHLQRVDIDIEPKEDVTGLVKIGEEITEQLECEPGKLYVKRYRRAKYAKPQGEGIITGELPSFIVPRGIAGASLLALILIQKYVDHLPLYRQIEIFKRMGIEIPSSTMSDWVALCINELTPLYEALKAKLLSANYLMADETPIKVLDRDKNGNIHLGYYWVYRDPGSGLVLFDYRPGRGRDGPTDILKNFEGFLQADGYPVYENFDTKKITLFHCMAHARRKFDEALDNDHDLAEYALLEMQKLYDVERICRELNYSHQQRYELRQEKSLPVLKNLHQWLKENMNNGNPKSPIRTAIHYSLQRWEKLMIYASNGMLEIDNNLVENSIRPVALGKKNYLFAGSHASARRAAMIYSLLGTCKLKGIEPFQWLKNVFEVLPDWKFNRLEELLP
jgi:transposase